MNTNRRYDVDWLRTLATGGIFLFHTARFFNNEDWHIKNNMSSEGATIFVAILVEWIMPLFFMLSALSVSYALTRRGNGQYLSERFQRLIIPLLFGIFTIIPPQVYIERITHGQFEGSFLQFLPHYFDGMYGFGGNFAWMGLHLWYLLMLFIFSLITLPLFRLLLKSASIPNLFAFFHKPGMIFLLSIPIMLVELFVNTRPNGIGIHDFGGWSPLSYLVIFILGYLISLDPRFQQTLARHAWAALVLAVVSIISGFLAVRYFHLSNRDELLAILRGFDTWAWLVAFMGLAARYLNFSNSFLKYASEASLPFYILHQSVIVIVAFFMVNLPLGVSMKYPLLAIIAFAIIMALYEGLVKRIKIFRCLFGMK